MSDRRYPARPGYRPGAPIAPVFTARVDDTAHVVACLRGGGFTAIRPDLWAVCRSIDEVGDTLRRWGARLREAPAGALLHHASHPYPREESGHP